MGQAVMIATAGGSTLLTTRYIRLSGVTPGFQQNGRPPKSV